MPVSFRVLRSKFLCLVGGVVSLLLLAGPAPGAGPDFGGLEGTRAPTFREALADESFTVGEYTLDCEVSGLPFRASFEAPVSGGEERERREQVLQVFRKLYFQGNHGREISPATQRLLEEFFRGRTGAWFARKMMGEIREAAEKGYLEFSVSPEAACHGDQRLSLPDLLTGELSSEGYFQDEWIPFEIQQHPGEGAFAQPGLVSFGSEGFREAFPVGGQPVDPIAIVAHEFGHTRYGDPESGGSLAGERETVLEYENPVRHLHGYEPRRIYYSYDLDQTIEIESGEILDGRPAPE